jgi:hypothetical protein
MRSPACRNGGFAAAAFARVDAAAPCSLRKIWFIGSSARPTPQFVIPAKAGIQCLRALEGAGFLLAQE